MDERCRWRKEAPWTAPAAGFKRQAAGKIELEPAVKAPGDFLVTVRRFGASLLVGMLPEKAATIDLPPLDGVVYDLLRGGPAARRIETSPEMPVLLVARPRRIARLELDRDLRLRLTEEGATPVDRSVVRCEVYDPSGRLVRHYSGNVTIENGSGQFAIPWALNEAPRGWRIRARDVLSGLVAEARL